MATAPEHPLAKNLESFIPAATTSIKEIRKQQRRSRIPGVVKRMIPVDATTSWEYWWCVPGRLLLSEDVELLQSDRPRVEAILAQLVWLWGGYCFDNTGTRTNECESIFFDWQQVINFGHQYLKPDVLDIDFLPIAVAPYNDEYIAVEPPHWHIEFFESQPTNGGFELPETKPRCSCQIWTSKPFIKHLKTGETTTRFDLWISRPLDLTNPLWQGTLLV